MANTKRTESKKGTVAESELTEKHIATIKDAARKLTGTTRRTFQAQVTLDYLDGKPRRAEDVFGWGRKTVELGLTELRTGITCVPDYSSRGRRPKANKRPDSESWSGYFFRAQPHMVG